MSLIFICRLYGDKNASRIRTYKNILIPQRKYNIYLYADKNAYWYPNFGHV